MKKHTLHTLALILLCVLAFFGYRIWDAGRTDLTAPEIQFSSGMPVFSVSASDAELLQGITATDNVDGDVTDSLILENIRMSNPDDRIAVITVAAFDRSGNVAKAEREISYSDYRSPRFVLERPMLFYNNSGINVLNFITANDLLDGDITQHIRATSLAEDSSSETGIFETEFRVTNSFGDTAELVIPVTFLNPGYYDAELTLKEYIVYLKKGEIFHPEDYLKEFIVNRSVSDLSNGLSADYDLQVTGTVDVHTPGTYVLDYLVTYSMTGSNASAATRSYSGFSRLIVVVEG